MLPSGAGVFAALYLEQVSGPVLLGMMYIGMFVFMPTAAAVKYAVALVVVMGAIRLVEWANEDALPYGGQYGSNYYHDPVGGGDFLNGRISPEFWRRRWRRVYIGSRDSFNRALHMIFHWGRKAGCQSGRMEEERAAAGVCGIVSGLVPGFSQYECRTSERCGGGTGTDTERNVTGKICASCDACAVCWERDPAPLYGALSGILSAIWNGDSREEEKAGACTVLQAQQ